MTAPSTSDSGPRPLNLKDFFQNATDYAILRISDSFPDFSKGADVDILCANPIAFLRHILEQGAVYEKAGYSIRVQATGRQLHVDFFPPQSQKLVFRFDLIDSLAMYDKFTVDSRYATDVLARARKITRQGLVLQVPDADDDLALRFLEYLQFVQQRPDKKKHLEYISRTGQLGFLKRIEEYTDLQVTVSGRNGGQHFDVTRRPAPAFSTTANQAPAEPAPFYALSSTCQVPRLSWYYEEIFSQRCNGLFVEVGAFDGDYVSNTSGLADLGWTGYYIEPVPRFFEKCRNRHAQNAKVTVTNCAIGAQRDKIRLHVAGPLTTSSSSMRDHMKTLEWAKGAFHAEETVEAEQFTLDQYLTGQKIEPGFELLIIDVEGGEWNVLKDFPIQRWKPQMVIIELHDQNKDYVLIHDQCRQIVDYFERNQYLPIYKDGTNTIYVAKEKLMAKRERMDYFLIWGHGLAHSEEIMRRIRRRHDLEILSIHKKQVPDLARFVQDLYACDTVPFEHLRSKTRYLLTTPREILFVLARNKNTQERYYGQGAFRHIQCALIKDVKEEIRNAFNPRTGNKRTEEHVIHGSDYESQVVHTLKILGLPPVSYYQRQPHAELHLPYHLGPIQNYRLCELSLDQVRARILGLGDVPIEQTPHYAYVQGNRRPYQEYHQRHLGQELTDDHFPAAFDRLIQEFDYEGTASRGKPSYMVVKVQKEGTYLLLDGVHRAAILKSQGKKTAQVIEILPADTQAQATVLVFSKDRAFQLDATLRSFLRHCHDVNPKDISILYRASTERHLQQYRALMQEHPQAHFIQEEDFKSHVIQLLRNCSHLLFLVDDCLFVRGFSLAAALQDLKQFPDALGFSLRLGRNTTYCYPHDRSQALPRFDSIREGVLKYAWAGAEYDFGYPLEVSSSIYRTADLLPLLVEKAFRNPNTLEGVLANHAGLYKKVRPHLLCFERSVAFCAPVNKVQAECPNRAGADQDCSVEGLAELFAAGQRLDIEAYRDFQAGACHQEVPLKLVSQELKAPKPPVAPISPASSGQPVAISIVIPCYRQAHYLPESVASVVAQTRADWEIIIVNDGSPDNTSEVARQLMDRYPDRRIQVIEKTNSGLASARNTGMRAARGRYLLPLDADDLLTPTFLEEAAAVLDNEPGMAVVFTDLQCFEGSNELIVKGEFGPNLLRENRVAYCALFRQAVWEAQGGYNPNMSLGYEDWDFWVGAVERGFKGWHIPKPLFRYRVRGQSMVTQSVRHHRSLFSRLVLNHPKHYDENTRRQAEEQLRLSPLSVPAGSDPVKVSVIIPCYRQAHFLTETVESVLAQTCSDWEIIIVNDGSPDNTSEVARNLMLKQPHRITLLEQRNGGLSCARNSGIRAARAEYIFLLDADDKIHPAMLEKTSAVLDANPRTGFAYTEIQHFGALNTAFPLPDFDRNTLIYKDNIICGNCLVRKSAWQQAGGYDETMREGYEDWNFWIACVAQGWTGHCIHEPLFYYRKTGQSMLANANQKRERLIARIVLNHPKLYDAARQAWARGVLEKSGATSLTRPTPVAQAAPAQPAQPVVARKSLRITYLISSIQGVTGGNQTLLRQAEEMGRRGHEVTILTYTPKPGWFNFQVRVLQVPAGQPMAGHVPPSDVVVATYFANAGELVNVSAQVKVYYAQGDQLVFADSTIAPTEQNRLMRELSRASYQIPGIRFVPNSRNLAGAVEKFCGRRPDGILPVCTDQTIFRPLQRALPGSRLRILIVGPDSRGTEMEPLLFKGIQDIHDALKLLAARFPHFTAVRMSSSQPDIFRQFPCEFYMTPSDEMKTMLYGTAHILVYASHYDSCPRPPQEAMAAGCAVVCTATAGAQEYCRHEENSLLVPIQSPPAIAEAVERLIRDPALRERLVQGGLATAREFPREREWNEWETMLYRFVDEAAIASPQPANGKDKVEKSASANTPHAAAARPLPACATVGSLANAQNLFSQKKLAEAWDSTSAALQARPFHPEAYLLLARIALAAGDSSSARRCARRAREIAPKWKPARQFLKGNLTGNSRPDWLKLPEAITQEPARPSQRVSVCMIVKNEERFLGQCLASVKDLASQIVIVDTGSTDRTVEIAKEFGAEIYHFAWCDDFSAARNVALEHATGDWILVLDADEELPATQHDRLRSDLGNSQVLAFRLPLINREREANGRSYVPRLYRNLPGAYYEGRIHEQVFSNLIKVGQPWGLTTGLGTAELVHHGYTADMTRDRNKVERNLSLLRQAIQEHPNNPHIAMSLGFDLVRSGDLKGGLVYCQQAFELMSRQPAEEVVPELREVLLAEYASHLYAAREYPRVVELLSSPLARQGGLTSSMHLILGLSQFELQQYRESAEQMRQCLKKLQDPTLAPVNTTIYTASPHLCLAVSLAKLGDIAGADQEFQAGLLKKGGLQELRLSYAKMLHLWNRPTEALKQLHAIISENSHHPEAWRLGGTIALSQPDFLEFARDWTGEAVQSQPRDSALQALRGEALLLSQDLAGAREVWEHIVKTEGSPKAQAALILCAIAGDSPPPADLNSSETVAAGQAFMAWYRKCLKFGASDLLQRLHARTHLLRPILPEVARIIEAISTEINRPAMVE